MYHLLLLILERRELVALLFCELLWDLHVAEILYLVGASFDHRACLDEGLLNFLPELLVVKVRTYLPVVILQILYLLLN